MEGCESAIVIAGLYFLSDAGDGSTTTEDTIILMINGKDKPL